MKKIAISLFSLIILSGCSLQTKYVNLSDVSEKIDKITSDELDLNEVVSNVEKDDSYEEMEYIKDPSILGLDADTLDEFVIRKSTSDSSKFGLYIILKPKKEYKDDVKKKMKEYINKLIEEENDEDNRYLLVNRVEHEYNDYLVYIVGKSSKTLLEKVLDSKKTVFSTLVNLSQIEAEDLDIVNSEDLDTYLLKVSGNLDKANAYFIIKPKKGKTEDIKEDIDAYFTKLEEKFKDDNIQSEIIKNRLETTINDYLVYIASSDNDKVLKVIDESLR